jgi:Tfp pilus assembly protein PilF
MRRQWVGFVIIVALSCMSSCATSSRSGSSGRQLTPTDRAKLHLAVASAALSEKDSHGALVSLADAEREDPKLADVHFTRSLALFMKGELDGALASARRALELDPNHRDAQNALGKLLLDRGRYDEAIPHLRRAAEDPLFGENYQPMTNLGVLYYKRGQLSQSETYLNKAISSAPDRACVAYYYRGHLRLKESRFKEAARDYDQATRRFCASFGDAHFAQGIALEYSKQYDQARKKYLEIQSRYPDTELAEKALNRLRALP